MAAVDVVIPYTPRIIFQPYHDSQLRNVLSVAHRRAGKTVARINKLVQKACECKLDQPRFGYLAPYYVQAKDIAWLYLKQYTAPIIEAVGGKVNESELTVTLGHNGAIIKLYGGENAERMRGLYFDGLCIDEAQGISKATLTTIILPCLADRQGWLDCSGTPKGWSNLLGELVKLAQANPQDWYLQILKASETNVLPIAELKRLQQLMPDNEYAQEFECDFDAAITGAYYGKDVALARTQGRITDVKYDSDFLVHTAWDLGYSDDTAIWWFQVIAGEIRILNFYATHGEDVEHYAGIILAKDYKYGTHYLPHDARAKTMASGGKSIIEQMASHLGHKHLAIAPELSIQDGIQAVRMAFPKIWFDQTLCAQGIEALAQYQREFNEDTKSFRDKPRHDWTSHAADAFRYLCLAYQEEYKQHLVDKPIRGITVGDNTVTMNEMWNTIPTRSGRI